MSLSATSASQGLNSAAEELSDEQVGHIIATNLAGSIQLIRASLPHLRAQAGRLSRQLDVPRHQLGHRGLRRVRRPGGGPVRDWCDLRRAGRARTEFRYGSARVAELLPAYDGTPAHGFQAMLDPPGDPARMAAAIIASVDQQPAPLRIMLGS